MTQAQQSRIKEIVLAGKQGNDIRAEEEKTSKYSKVLLHRHVKEFEPQLLEFFFKTAQRSEVPLSERTASSPTISTDFRSRD